MGFARLPMSFLIYTRNICIDGQANIQPYLSPDLPIQLQSNFAQCQPIVRLNVLPKKNSDYALWLKSCGLFKFFSYRPWHVYVEGPAAQEISTYLVNYVVC
jgi:hypothetical protein